MNELVTLHAKDKVKVNRKCSENEHTFIPAAWKTSPSSYTCTLFVCQHCLMSVDKADVEVMTMENKGRLQKKKKAALDSPTNQ